MRRLLTLPSLLPTSWTATFILLVLCGCSWQKFIPAADPTIPNGVAIDRALRVCSLTQGEQPFHLVLSITRPEHAVADMSAQIELSWLNPVTYRIAIRSHDFTQVRIVNGPVVEEHDTGPFYPRWIQNFVDALLNPIPNLAALRKIPGSIPIAAATHACISTVSDIANLSGDVPPESLDPTRLARVCFQDGDPKIASAMNFTRSVWFDDYAPFGSQQIPRTLVNALPGNLQLRAHIVRLEPLAPAEERLVKAHQFTPPARQVLTSLTSESIARSLLLYPSPSTLPEPAAGESITVYIRTDRTGQVREVYRANSDNAVDLYGVPETSLRRTFAFRFRPLLINGVAYQMEAPLRFPSKTPTR